MLVRPFLALMPHLPAAEPFGQRQANRAFHFLHQISGEAEMIEMRMREGEVLQRAGAQQPPPQLVPDLEGVVGVQAAVDQRPSRPVVEQPAIDVIGRRRHREPHPEQSRQDIGQFAVGRRTLDREFQIIGHYSHPGRVQPSKISSRRLGLSVGASLRDLVGSSTRQGLLCFPDRSGQQKSSVQTLERKPIFLENVSRRLRDPAMRSLPRPAGQEQ